MASISDIHSIIVPAQNANLQLHMYTEVYGGSAGCSVNINRNLLSIGPSKSIKIWVNNISGGTGCFLLGENQDVFQGSTSLDNTPTTPVTPTTCWILTTGFWVDGCTWDDSSVWVD